MPVAIASRESGRRDARSHRRRALAGRPSLQARGAASGWVPAVGASMLRCMSGGRPPTPAIRGQDSAMGLRPVSTRRTEPRSRLRLRSHAEAVLVAQAAAHRQHPLVFGDEDVAPTSDLRLDVPAILAAGLASRPIPIRVDQRRRAQHGNRAARATALRQKGPRRLVAAARLLPGERSKSPLAPAACHPARNAGADRCGVHGSWSSSIAGVGPAS
jgi:hypothetical protein